MRLNYLANALANILKYYGIVTFIPFFVAIYYHDKSSILPFLIPTLFSLYFGFILRKYFTKNENLNDIKKSEALVVVSLSWILISLISAIPYLFYGFNVIDSIFEGVSGITTTGATIFQRFDYPKPLLFWRCFSQWIGGMGIIVLFVAILPQFAVAGRQMFFAESSVSTEDKFTPRIKNTASAIWLIYSCLTVLCAILLIIFGMPVFDAICNSFSTLSAGGLCPNKLSIEGYHSNIINWIIIIFMFLAGCSFVLQTKIISKRKLSMFLKSEEFICYLSSVLAFSGIISGILILTQGYSLFNSITAALYQVMSFATSTGSTSENYQLWNFSAKIFLFLSAFISSCSGSAGGGIKITRWILIFKYIKNELYKILHPNAVLTIKIDGKVVNPYVVKQTIFFVLSFFGIFAISAILFTLAEQDFIVGVTSSIASLGCIGPAFGSVAQNYADLTIFSKTLYSINMLVGRLEIIPFLVLFQKDLWKNFKN